MEKKRGKKAWKSCGTVRKYRSNSSREFHRKKEEKVLRNSTEISWPGWLYVAKSGEEWIKVDKSGDFMWLSGFMWL